MSTCERSTSLLLVCFPRTVVVPKYVSAAVVVQAHDPPGAVVGPPVITIAADTGAAMPTAASTTASATMVACGSPRRRAL